MIMKRVSLLVLAICLSLVLLSPCLVQARDGLAVLESSAEVKFPSSLNFSLSAESDANITDIRLHYTVDQVSYAQVTSEVYIEFTPATKVKAAWSWDMRRTGGLPPGSGVSYWWTVKDAKGNQVETSPVRVGFDDNRYSWHSLTEGNVTLYWYEASESFAQDLMVTAQQALIQLDKDTGAHLEKSVKVYIYADAQDLMGAMIYPREWTGGVAFTRYGIIAIGIAPNNLQWGEGAIAHELAHLVIHQMTFNPYGGLPTWLDEGLAMHAEGKLNPGFTDYLNEAITEGNLISVRSLSSPFSAYAEQSYLSYAQSYSLVDFLIGKYGQGKMLELLNTFREGNNHDGAFKKVYGFDMDGLNIRWQDYVTSPTQTFEKKGTSPLLIGLLSALAIAVLLWLGLAVKRRAWRRGS